MPGFAGYYFDADERLVIRLVDPSMRDSARERALDALVRSGRELLTRSGSPLTVLFAEARYSFGELAGWRDSLYQHAFTRMQGVVSLDLNEAENRVVVGVLNDETGELVQQLASSFRIPVDALVIERGSYDRPTQHSLHSRIRPFMGGSRIGPSGCTLSFAARQNGQAVLLTAGHCSSTWHQTDGGVIQQPYYTPGSSYSIFDAPFGAEIFEDDGYVLWGTTYRLADVSVYDTLGTVGMSNELVFLVGRIAKPTQRLWGGYNAAGALTIDSTDSFLEIHGGISTQVDGELVDKIGITTGWTYGQVDGTCVDRTKGSTKLLCQAYAHINAEQGDSGAPVFKYYGRMEISLMGIVWGKNDNHETIGFFSDLEQIEAEIGSFDFMIEPF